MSHTGRIVTTAAMIGVAGLAAACQSATAPGGPVSAYDTRVRATPDPTQFSGAGYDVTIENTGNGTVYVQQCGDAVWLIVDEWVDGRWVRAPEPDCQPTTVQLSIAPGNAIQDATSFAIAGRYRVGVRVSPASDMANMREALSAAIDVK